MNRRRSTSKSIARHSFVEGMARVLDIGNTFHQCIGTRAPGDTDYRAMLSDWAATGDDLRFSIESYGQRISAVPSR